MHLFPFALGHLLSPSCAIQAVNPVWWLGAGRELEFDF